MYVEGCLGWALASMHHFRGNLVCWCGKGKWACLVVGGRWLIERGSVSLPTQFQKTCEQIGNKSLSIINFGEFGEMSNSHFASFQDYFFHFLLILRLNWGHLSVQKPTLLTWEPTARLSINVLSCWRRVFCNEKNPKNQGCAILLIRSTLPVNYLITKMMLNPKTFWTDDKTKLTIPQP